MRAFQCMIIVQLFFLNRNDSSVLATSVVFTITIIYRNVL
jgi:hypothetical protein